MKRTNLIPEEAKKITFKKRFKLQIFKSPLSRAIAATAAVFILMNLWQGTAIFRYRLAVRQGKNGILKLQLKLAETQNAYAQLNVQKQSIDAEVKQVESRLLTLQQIQTGRLVWAKVLVNLSQLLPQELWVNKISLNKELITISGTTVDNAVVSRFMARLDESEYFRDTSFNYTQKAELTDKPVINFEITTHVVVEKIMK